MITFIRLVRVPISMNGSGSLIASTRLLRLKRGVASHRTGSCILIHALTADFTEFDPLYERQFEPIESDVTIVPLPSRNLNMTFRFTHDPNPHPEDGQQFKMVGFRSNIVIHAKHGTSVSGVLLAKGIPQGALPVLSLLPDATV